MENQEILPKTNKKLAFKDKLFKLLYEIKTALTKGEENEQGVVLMS